MSSNGESGSETERPKKPSRWRFEYLFSIVAAVVGGITVIGPWGVNFDILGMALAIAGLVLWFLQEAIIRAW